MPLKISHLLPSTAWITTWTWVSPALLFVFLCFYMIRSWRRQTASRKLAYSFPEITPLPNFTWHTTEPTSFRPFKPKYHLTMGLSNIPISGLIPMDKTYSARLAYRRAILSQHRDVVIGVHDDPADTRIREAVKELYAFVMGWYLPRRYPGMFRVISNSSAHCEKAEELEEEGMLMLENGVTGDVHPAILPSSYTTERGLEILGTTVDQDFLILLHDPSTSCPSKPEEEKYALYAYTTFYPAGFNPSHKLGLRLADIHTPVPGYASKLERSMDRLFARLEVGRVVGRVNWSVNLPGVELFAVDGAHAYDDDDYEEGEKPVAAGEIDGENTVLRCERQTLHRLPHSKALVFSFHTYTYPIRMVKEEGLGEEMAAAIDGLEEGNVPEIHFYKKGGVWGEGVKGFLRS